MKKKKAILGALFLITLLFVGFSIAEPISAAPDSLTTSDSDDPGSKDLSLNLVDVFDDDDETNDDDDDDDDETNDDDDDDDDETNDDDDDDDDETNDDDDDDDDEIYTKEQAENKINEAEDKIKEVEDKIGPANSVDDDDNETDDDDDDEVETSDDDDDDDDDEARDELEDAKEHLAEAKEAFAEGDYTEAYEAAEEAIEEAEEALNELNESESGEQDDIDEDETAEEDAAERNLHVIVLLNGQDATDTSEANPIQVSGDATIKVIIENEGSSVIIEEIEIKTSTGDVQVSSFELSGATLSSGTSVEFTNEVDTGLLGTLAEIFSDPLYESYIEIKMKNGWDYELVVYWQAA